MLAADPADPMAALHAKLRDGKVRGSDVPEIEGDRTLSRGTKPTDLADTDDGVVRAAFAVAETGSIRLTDREFGLNTLGYLPQHLIVLLDPPESSRTFIKSTDARNGGTRTMHRSRPGQRPRPVERALRYEPASVSGIHLEDQLAPKRCGHMAGKQVIGADEAVDALAAEGVDKSIERALRDRDVGADLPATTTQVVSGRASRLAVSNKTEDAQAAPMTSSAMRRPWRNGTPLPRVYRLRPLLLGR